MDYFNKMDGPGGYVRASLLGLSQGMNPLHDPLRLHPALHNQITDAGKDGSNLLRPLTEYPHIPLLPFSAPHFLPHHFDPRFPFTHSAFHSLHPKLPPVSVSTSPLLSTNSTSNNSSISSITGSPSLSGSAFAPLPPKVSKMDPDTTPISSANIFSHSVLMSTLEARNAFLGGRSPPLVSGGPLSEERRDSPSPMGSHGSRESPAHGREASTPTSPDDIRVRKTRPPGECWCPVCGLTLRPGDYESHLGFELQNFAKDLQARPTTPNASPVVNVANSPHRPHLTSLIRQRDPGWETYQRVRANRQVRLRAKKRRSGRMDSCPICCERLAINSPDEIQGHVEQCIRRASIFGLLQQNMPEEEADVDVEGDSPYEEFDWCGQRRLRVSSLLRSQAQPMQITREADAQTPLSDKEANGSNQEAKTPGREDGRVDEEGRREEGEEGRVDRASSEALVKELETLKEKIRLMEKDGSEASKFLCLVCQRAYDRPAVSMICWHVFCESCWPHSMETKAECPQCSSVFNADDIRIIHL